MVGDCLLQIIMTALLNAGASFLLKKAALFTDAWRHLGLMLAGIAVYGVSFLFYSYVLQKYDASFAYTLVTGLTIVCLSMASYAFLGELFSLGKIVGMGLIFAGIVCLAAYG
jgi:small multidrug resistance pump